MAPCGLIASLPVTISFTFPPWSTTKVARLANPRSTTVPPYCFATLPPSSERSGKGSLCSALNRFWVATSSVEIPTTCAPLPTIVAY